MRFWQIKHAENPELAEKVLAVDRKDTYERTDNFNVYGLFCFFTLRLRSAFLKWMGNTDNKLFGINVTAQFNSPSRHVFTYELYQPLLVICMRSKSETIRAFASETIDIFAYLLLDEKRKFDHICLFQSDTSVPFELFSQLFTNLGDQNSRLAPQCQHDTKQVQNTRLRVLNQLLQCYAVPIHLQLLENALTKFQSDKNDTGVCILTSVFYKEIFKQQANDSEALKALLVHMRDTWLPQTLDPMRNEDSYILEILDSLAAALNVLSFAFNLELQKAPEAQVLNSSNFLDSLSQKYFEPLT